MSRRAASTLRSARWFAPDDCRCFVHRSRLLPMGCGPDDWAGKPVMAIVNSWSDANRCHEHLEQRVEDLERGVLQAGALPLELPSISLSELFGRHVLQPDPGCDFDLLETGFGAALPEPDIF